MAIWFFSDPHLGVSRSAHTTAQSRAKLKGKVFDHLTGALYPLQGEKFCLGDLFDKESNDEATILQGLEIAGMCRAVLAGNHDLPNREGKASSMELVDVALRRSETFSPVVMAKAGEAGHEFMHTRDAWLYLVPHVTSQDLFDQSLASAEKEAGADKGLARILCLHCNYDSHFTEGSDASLNLTKERAAELLNTFDFILLGHEHQPRTDFGGRLIVLGNTHASSFADISHKYVWKFEDGKFDRHMVWSATKHHAGIGWETLLTATDVNWSQAQFITVEGTAPASRMPEIAEAVAKLWQQAPDALMIRNAVEVEEEQQAEVKFRKALNLPDRVTEALTGGELEGVWKEYLGRAQG